MVKYTGFRSGYVIHITPDSVHRKKSLEADPVFHMMDEM